MSVKKHKSHNPRYGMVVKHIPEPTTIKPRYRTENGNVWDLVVHKDGTWDYRLAR